MWHLIHQARREFPKLLHYVPDSSFRAVEADGEIVGVRIPGRFLWIRPERRGEGLALREIERSPATEIVIDPSNAASVALYTRAGYRRVALKGDGPLEIWSNS